MSKRSSGDGYGASKNQWHDMPGVHADALGTWSDLGSGEIELVSLNFWAGRFCMFLHVL